MSNPATLILGTPTVEAITPSPIILHPPRKLVLEVRTAGRYQLIRWRRNSNEVGMGDFHPGSGNFSHFSEVYTRVPTTASDFGVYDIHLVTGTVVHTTTSIAVVQFGMYACTI